MEKLCLLKYVLKDALFSELLGLELLPVSDGNFAAFSNSPGEAIYIASRKHPQELLPGLRDHFLDQDVDGDTLTKLKAVALKGTDLFQVYFICHTKLIEISKSKKRSLRSINRSLGWLSGWLSRLKVPKIPC